MLSIYCFLLTFFGNFCKIKRYKGDKRSFAAVGCAVILLCGCHTADPTPSPAVSDEDMRGVWLSYLELDAALAGSTPHEAEETILAMMDTCAKNGLNAVFFHVRAHGDAYFPSTVWRAADAAAALIQDGFDPLACAVEAAHRHGIALHAWINPYRIGKATVSDALSFEKDGTRYYAPNDPAARQLVLDGAREILDNYAVDGIHFDDYFYPAGMHPQGESFEDIPHGADVTAWRQAQVDALVSGIYGLCRQRGKLFGVSPTADVEKNLNQSYANVTRWMTEAGYLDYLCPQLYVGFRHQTKPFAAWLTQWVALPRRHGVKLYVGLALYKVGLDHDPYAGSGADEWSTDTDILPRQIAAATEQADGYVLFRYGNL